MLAQFRVLGLWVLAVMNVWYLLNAVCPVHLLICCTMTADWKIGIHQANLVNPTPRKLAAKLDFLTLLVQFLVFGLWVLAMVSVWHLLLAVCPFHQLICCFFIAG